VNDRHKAFIEQYLISYNATDAYQAVYTTVSRASAAANGWRLLQSADVQEAISQRLAETAMSANEVLMRLAQQARGDVDDYLDDNGNFDLAKARQAKKTGIVKKLKTKTTKRIFDDETVETVEVEFELYDAQAALVHLGKHHRLFADRTEVTGANGGPIEQRAKVDHAIDSSTAESIFDVLAAAGVLTTAPDDAKDDKVHPA